MGFILAASGSAIGLGNIVMFSSNAYRFGGGAFYLPYFIALFLVGMPVMVAEFGLGASTRKSFPLAMRVAGGRAGEFAGWFAILNAGFITMYYITILGWVAGMAWGALTTDVTASFGASAKPPFFDSFKMTYGPFFGVVLVWILNLLIVSRGTKSIEPVVKVFLPLMWLAMIVLVFVGMSLPGGFEGVKVLFTPQPEVLGDLSVWQGALSQMFFSLSLGFGVMTAYASYLPKDSDLTHNAVTTSLLNCGFEWIAGVAVFSILFSFAIAPSSSTIAMMFYVVPAGIAAMPFAAKAFAIGFFLLLLVAGLTSSISLLEALVAAGQDKFRLPRWRTLAIFGTVGVIGSLVFALPAAALPGLPLGLWLLDLTDHWAFGYGLLIVGLVECIVIGWVVGSGRIRDFVNANSRFRLGVWFDLLLRFVIPGLLLMILISAVSQGEAGGLYGTKTDFSKTEGILGSFLRVSPWVVFLVWMLGGGGLAWWLSGRRGVEEGLPDLEAPLPSGPGVRSAGEGTAGEVDS